MSGIYIGPIVECALLKREINIQEIFERIKEALCYPISDYFYTFMEECDCHLWMPNQKRNNWYPTTFGHDERTWVTIVDCDIGNDKLKQLFAPELEMLASIYGSENMKYSFGVIND